MTTNLPTIVSYTLEDILDRFEQKIERQFAEVNEKLSHLQIGQIQLSGEIKTLEERVNGIGKRIDNQEFASRVGSRLPSWFH